MGRGKRGEFKLDERMCLLLPRLHFALRCGLKAARLTASECQSEIGGGGERRCEEQVSMLLWPKYRLEYYSISLGEISK